MENDKHPYCPFQPAGLTHTGRPPRGFSMGFQHLCICEECISMALAGRFTWRWRAPQEGETCFRCQQPKKQLFAAAPGEADVAICRQCLQAGRAYLDAPEEEEGLFTHQTISEK